MRRLHLVPPERSPCADTLERGDTRAFVTALALVARRRVRPALTYRSGDRCPGCGRSAWIIGRALAECHHCSHALPLENVNV